MPYGNCGHERVNKRAEKKIAKFQMLCSLQITVMEHFTDNPQWELLKIIGTSKEIQHDCCNTYRVLEYRLYIRRRSPFYKFVLVVPSVLAMILTLALFWLPPYAGEKIILGGIVIIIQVALLLFLGWAIPPGGASVPAIGKEFHDEKTP